MSFARLVYVSTARPGLEPAEIDALLGVARARNEALSLTGLLVFNGVRFMQALEGPARALDAVYASIRADARHSALVDLYRENARTRAFPGWSMAYAAMRGQAAAAGALRAAPDRVGAFVPETAGADLALLFTSFNAMDADASDRP